MSENTCKRELLIEVPADIVRAATDKVAKGVQREARIPGFRPGKTPMSIVMARFAEHIREEVLKDLVPEYFRAKAIEEKLAPVAMPSFEDVHFHDGEPLTFKAVFEVLPDFEVGEYRDLEVEYAEPEVKEYELDRALARWQERDATFEPVEEGRALVDGDFADVSFEGHPVGGKGAPVKVDEVLIEIGGKDTVPEFTENLRGAEAGQTREFVIAYPADFHDKRLAGRSLKYQVKVHAIKAKKLADLDDDFAKATGEFETLAELREDLRVRLLQQKKNRREVEAKNKLVEKLVDAHSFPVPEAMIQRQLEVRMERLVRELQQQGINPEKSIDWNAWRDHSVEPATKEVRAELLLNKIGERESLDATDEEFEEEIRYMARAMRQSEDAVRARIKRDESEGRIRYRIRNAKAQDFLFKNARYVAPAVPEKPEDSEAESEQAEADVVPAEHDHEEEHDLHDEVPE